MDVCEVCDGTGALLSDTCPLCDGVDSRLDVAQGLPAEPASEQPSIMHLSEKILADLKRYKPMKVGDMDPSLHYLAPHVPKATWDSLGDLVAAREKSTLQNVDGTRWISLRLDGSGFSKAVRVMRRHGILESEGFSERFADCMQGSLRSLMEKFHAVLGYTQSDEMIVFIPPASIVRGEQMVHTYSGRVTKMTTLAAGFVTANFLMQLSQMCLSKGVGLEGLATVLPHFDCRIGQYDSWEEARALLMWRAYDCSVNGVSDAVYHSKGSGKQIMSSGKSEKIEWLWKQGLLPLPRHQAYGTVLAKVKRAVQGYNPQKKEYVTSLRGLIERVDGPVLELARRDALFPKEDEP